MTPQTVNAVNMPAMNALNFPAAILQPPFFDRDARRRDELRRHRRGDRPRDQPQLRQPRRRRSTAQGRLRNWWTAADFAHFNASTHALALQYDAYHPLPDLAINGQQTLSENIADLAGLTAAYDAWQRVARREAGAGGRRRSPATSSSS